MMKPSSKNLLPLPLLNSPIHFMLIKCSSKRIIVAAILTILFLSVSSTTHARGQTELNLENTFQNYSEPHPAILNSAIYKGPVSQSHIFGEVLNNFTYPISVVKVYATVKNTTGDVIVTSDGFTKERYLKPGHKSGFWILVQKDVPEHSNYSLVSTFENVSITKPDSLRINVNLVSTNPIKIVGTITNVGKELATDLHVNGIFYDSSHKVVDSADTFINILSGLGPGQGGIFELQPILNYENQDKIKSVVLSAESAEYTNIPISDIVK